MKTISLIVLKSFLSTLYMGLDSKCPSLNTTSNSDFTTKTVAEKRALIDNLAASNSCLEYDGTMRLNDYDSNKSLKSTDVCSEF